MTPVDIGGRLVPALLVRDMSETLAFYQTLGFTLTGCYPNPIAPTWAAVSRASVTLQFHTDPPHGTPPEPVCSGTFYIFPESVPKLADELRGKAPLLHRVHRARVTIVDRRYQVFTSRMTPVETR
jgi:catechol 2,3-dioxygenase-like lactoylglutathione lyase family enzyme